MIVQYQLIELEIYDASNWNNSPPVAMLHYLNTLSWLLLPFISLTP